MYLELGEWRFRLRVQQCRGVGDRGVASFPCPLGVPLLILRWTTHQCDFINDSEYRFMMTYVYTQVYLSIYSYYSPIHIHECAYEAVALGSGPHRYRANNKSK